MATYTNRPVAELMTVINAAADQAIRKEFPAPEYSLEEIANGVSAELTQSDTKKPKNASHILASDPGLMAQIEAEVGSAKKFGFAGVGDNALVLTYDNDAGNRQILRITTANESTFPGSQHVLQPNKQYSIGNLTVQHSDIALSLDAIMDDSRRTRDGLINHKLISQSEANDLMQHLQEKLYQEGVYLHDNHLGNAAITADGRLLTPDPGAVSTIEQHQQYLATLDDEARKSKMQQMESVAERAAASEHLHAKGKGAVGLMLGAGLALASGTASARNAQGGPTEKVQAFKDGVLSNLEEMLPVINAEKAMQEGKPNEAIARLADWTPAGEPNRYLQRLHAAVSGKATDVEPGMIESLSTSTLDTLKYAANKGNEALDNLQEHIGLPTKRTTDAEKLANKNAFMQAADAIMAGDTNYKIPQDSHITVKATVANFHNLHNYLSRNGGLNAEDLKTLDMARQRISEGFDAPLYGPLKGIVHKYEASLAIETDFQQAELSR
ncbi:MAG: hypothetical protein RL194_548 [Pseudomonadota bacterium]|jgi:hypothetical protein